jgi:hypothetical protein
MSRRIEPNLMSCWLESLVIAALNRREALIDRPRRLRQTMSQRVTSRQQPCCRLLSVYDKREAMAKKPVVGVRLDPQIKDALERRAAALERSLSFLIAKLCRDWLETQDVPPKGRQPTKPSRSS